MSKEAKLVKASKAFNEQSLLDLVKESVNTVLPIINKARADINNHLKRHQEDDEGVFAFPMAVRSEVIKELTNLVGKMKNLTSDETLIDKYTDLFTSQVDKEMDKLGVPYEHDLVAVDDLSALELNQLLDYVKNYIQGDRFRFQSEYPWFKHLYQRDKHGFRVKTLGNEIDKELTNLIETRFEDFKTVGVMPESVNQNLITSFIDSLVESYHTSTLWIRYEKRIKQTKNELRDLANLIETMVYKGDYNTHPVKEFIDSCFRMRLFTPRVRYFDLKNTTLSWEYKYTPVSKYLTYSEQSSELNGDKLYQLVEVLLSTYHKYDARNPAVMAFNPHHLEAVIKNIVNPFTNNSIVFDVVMGESEIQKCLKEHLKLLVAVKIRNTLESKFIERLKTQSQKA